MSSLKLKDIIHENGRFWVHKQKDCYVVFRSGITHSVPDSAYHRTDDGLTLAITRCDYLAKNSKHR